MSQSRTDTAEEYFNVRRTYRLQGGGDVLVGPAPGGLRNTICQEAQQQPIGGRFDPKYWNCTSPLQSGPPHVQWCGIYDTWVWLQANLQVEWAFVPDPPNTPATDRGKNNGPYKAGSGSRIKTSTIRDKIAPGDIVVESTGAVHHLLVLSASADGIAEVLEGNAGPGDKAHTIVRRRGGYHLIKVGYFYSVDSYRWPEVNYGMNFPGKR